VIITDASAYQQEIKQVGSSSSNSVLFVVRGWGGGALFYFVFYFCFDHFIILFVSYHIKPLIFFLILKGSHQYIDYIRQKQSNIESREINRISPKNIIRQPKKNQRKKKSTSKKGGKRRQLKKKQQQQQQQQTKQNDKIQS
jgi:hypothetical protein